MLGGVVGKVRLYEDQIEFELDSDWLWQRLMFKAPDHCDEAIVITVPAVRVRRGHQLRLIIPGPEDAKKKAARRDDKLVGLLAEAQQARQLVLGNPSSSLASLARDHGRCRTRLGKLVALSCLAPDIVTAIVEGRQPDHLTAARLMSASLPLAWSDQQRELGIS